MREAERTPRRVSSRRTPRARCGAAPTIVVDADHLLDTHAAAAFLGVAPRTLYKWAAQGRLPVVRLGRMVRFRLATLQALVREHEEAAPAPGVITSRFADGTESAPGDRS